MSPWVGRQFKRSLLTHLFALPMMLIYYDWPEHHAFFLKVRRREFNHNIYTKPFFLFQAHVVPTLLFIGSILSAFMYSHPDFYKCPNEEILENGSTFCHGSIIMGINGFVDIYKDLFFIPIIAFAGHKILIACKYASLSADEYASYVHENDEATRMRNMLSLNMLTTRVEMGSELRDQILCHEVEMAFARSSTGGRAEFYVDIPAKEDSKEAHNFRNWQALLLGRTHHHGISWHEVDPKLKKMILRRKIGSGEKEYYVIDLHQVLASIMKWSDKINYSQNLHHSVANWVSRIVPLVPLISMFRVVDSSVFFHNPRYAMIFLVTLICFAIVSYTMLPPLLNIAVYARVYYQKKAVRAHLLQEMLRTNDLDPANKLRTVGITPSQRTPIQDMVELDEKAVRRLLKQSEDSDKDACFPSLQGAMDIVSKRNPNIARMPSIAYMIPTLNGHEENGCLSARTNNILSWTILRSCTKDIYSRAEGRLQIACSLNMWICMILGAVLLYGYQRTLSSNSNGNIVSGASQTNAGDLYISSPISIQILCLLIFFAFYTGLTILAGVDVNTSYSNHYHSLKSVMNYTQGRMDDMTEKYKTNYAKLQRVAHAYMIAFKYVSALDYVKYTKLFGVGTSVNLLTFYGTVLTSVASMLTVAWSAMVNLGKF